ncbi:glucose-6-phosphate dehydrogenase [Rubinisphaera sp. JC750]|uniref:glucose-6-phosphate dehydrogenase n=1 Tax=Rubinisphaera sp. JC750 TaxID=2898658 RepID=UPI001F006816|nr:glucose-6-phosphate dehydrogenase [Rubinisphaera sp. JC750]
MSQSGSQTPLQFSASQAFGDLGEPASILIFGASGDLTARKLLPALYTLWKTGYLPEKSQIIGVARREKTDESFGQEMFEAVQSGSRIGDVSEADWNEFAKRLHYRQVDLQEPEQMDQFRTSLEELERQTGLGGQRLVYMATAPHLFLPSVEALHNAGMIPDPHEPNWLRVVFEKPFGHDLPSAQELSNSLSRMLDETQIYRIDHYLGKETVQNILLFRFGNSIFEPLLNRNHVDHVQITVAESQGMERGRGGYYDQSGALRDVLQNHVLQLLCLIAMEPPSLFRADNIRDEKLKVLQALRPGGNNINDWAIAGQYTAAEVDGKVMKGYRQEDRIPEASRRESFVAMEAHVDNWRWEGVPFYLRTGKRLPLRVTEIAVKFKLPPLNLFTTVECDGDMCALVEAQPNTLIFRIQPHEGISLTCSTKRPGMQYQIHPVTMNFAYGETFEAGLPEAYERLLLDVMRGDTTLFTRSDELEAAWRFVNPVLEEWENRSDDPCFYPAGSWGPKESKQLLEKNGRSWRRPSGAKPG